MRNPWPYIVVGATWLAGFGCATYLTLHGHPAVGVLILLVAACAGTS